MQSEKVNLRDFLIGKSKLGEIKKIIIPDVQRDYVMGSGGKKLESLFKEMNKHKEEFYFSCIMGYKDNENIFYIYDGQQRLVTLIYLVAYLSNAQTDDTYIEQIKKFSFIGRKSANEYIDSLLKGKEADICIDDYTTFSIHNLINCFREQKYVSSPDEENNIDIKYLMQKVYFELVSVEKVGDAEQFFMDLNDGLDLEDYEIFKAELYHKAKQILGVDFKAFALSMENKWLRFFRNYQPKDCSSEWYEEEIEILFIKFCFYMMWIEQEGDIEKYNENNIDWIEKKHLYRVQEIINNIIDLQISEETCQCVNYSFDTIGREYTKEINSIEGVFWNLEDSNYSSMLNLFLKSFYTNKENVNGHRVSIIKEEAKRDVIIWSYISNLDKDIEMLLSYLRTIKLLLNKNVVQNTQAYYDEKHNMWYAEYSTYAIPTYYLKLEDSFATSNQEQKDYNNYVESIIILNTQFKECIELSERLHVGDDRLNTIIVKQRKRLFSQDYEEIKKLENLPYINGFVDNLLDENEKPIITAEELQKKLEEIEHSGIRSIMINLIDQFSYLDVDNIEETIFKHISRVSWKSYTGNVSSFENVILPIQTLTDLFIDTDLENVIQLWISKKIVDVKPINNMLLFMRAYKYIPRKGWSNKGKQIVYPDYYYAYDDYGNRTRRRGFCSSNGMFPNISRNIRGYIHHLTAQPNLSNCDIDIKDSITYQLTQDWLQKQLGNELYYCDQKWVYYALLDDYLRSNPTEEENIKKLAKDKEITLVCYGKNFFIPNSVLKEYTKML
ncbi:DUF262 domain-containing protein [Clostridium sulfidigenes]|uniref:DUF262 domain-containing protein n=1 Tax=Clostridium sulfidigenes TaxID=318464 RepID=UPI003F8CD280